MIKFIIRYFKKEFKSNMKLYYNFNYIKITYPKKINKNLKKKFFLLRKKIKIYYEFPPIIKFDYEKRFKKILNNFDEGISNTYKVKKSIFNKNEINLSNELKKELNVQYSNICYINLN